MNTKPVALRAQIDVNRLMAWQTAPWASKVSRQAMDDRGRRYIVPWAVARVYWFKAFTADMYKTCGCIDARVDDIFRRGCDPGCHSTEFSPLLDAADRRVLNLEAMSWEVR